MDMVDMVDMMDMVIPPYIGYIGYMVDGPLQGFDGMGWCGNANNLWW